VIVKGAAQRVDTPPMDTARTGLTAEDIGVRLRAVRELTGLTVGQVSKASGVPRRDINAAEHGRRVLDADATRAVAGVLGVAPGVLVAPASHSVQDEPLDDASWGQQVDEVVGHDPDRWHELPATPADLPAPIPFDLPSSERRIDHDTRAKLDQSWVAVRNEMHEVIDAATRLAMCTSNDDPSALMRDLQFEIDKLHRKRSFQKHVARHQAEVLAARGATQSPESGD
jgi:transcriptional regulator with XRE-family HTH domain